MTILIWRELISTDVISTNFMKDVGDSHVNILVIFYCLISHCKSFIRSMDSQKKAKENKDIMLRIRMTEIMNKN